MGRRRSDYKDFEVFFKLLFSLWINSQKARQAHPREIVVSDKNHRECIKDEWDQAKNDEDGNLGDIDINNKKVQVVISNDNYIIIKLENNIFLAICVVQELGNYVLKITGLDFTNTNEGQEGLKTEYLIKLIEKIGCSFSAVDKVNRLRRQLFSPLRREQIFIQNQAQKGQNHYFYFTFKLKEDLKNEENVVNNVDYYTTILTGDTVREIDYDLIEVPDSLQDKYGYIERPDIESECYEKIATGDFIRIKGSVGMGKTWLLKQMIEYAKNQGHFTIRLDFNEPEKAVFDDLKIFYTWFCDAIGRTLGIQQSESFIPYTNYNSTPSINANTKYYFEDHLLNNRDNQPKMVLAIDNVDRLFTFPNIVNSVCNLWRGWYDEYNGKIRNNMIMLITYSTDEYPNFNINNSPLQGIGHESNLSDWEVPQVESIAQQYGLDLSVEEINQLMTLIGGHPYLVRKAIEYLHQTPTNVENLLKIATNEDSPFSSYLDQLLQNLENLPELCKIYSQIIRGFSVSLNRTSKFHLKSMGLIKTSGDQILPKYSLYHDYFLKHLNQGE